MKPAHALHEVAEAFEIASLFILVSPLAFPAIALLDGAQDEYLAFSIACLCFAMVLVFPAIGLCACLSDLAASLADMAAAREEQRKEDARAFRQYLLNGGRV